MAASSLLGPAEGRVGVAPVADLLDHLAPPAGVWPVVLLTCPVDPMAEALHERARRPAG